MYSDGRPKNNSIFSIEENPNSKKKKANTPPHPSSNRNPPTAGHAFRIVRWIS